MKVLAFCDAPKPILPTGFACVAGNIFKHWLAAGVEVDVWGIGFDGWGYEAFPGRIFPAAARDGDWQSTDRLTLFLNQIVTGDYTHVWIMQDTFALTRSDFPQKFLQVCRNKRIRTMMYFPVDAPLERDWTAILAAVDVPVAYTQFGKLEAEAKAKQLGHDIECQVLPHGVDPDVFKPEPRRRDMWDPQWVGEDDFLMLNVNVFQRRKDVTRCFEILAGLRKLGIPAKLLMHMAAHNGVNTSLEKVAPQYGVRRMHEWNHHGDLFTGIWKAKFTERELCVIYNAADLYLSTTLGEGWGLGITEALACGTPVAVPNHTACAEIFHTLTRFGMRPGVLMPVEKTGVVLDSDNSRVRHRVDVPAAVEAIAEYYHSGEWRERKTLNAASLKWMSWPRIAGQMLEFLRGPEIAVESKDRSAIPLLAVPILNRGDLLMRLVRSMDYAVDRLVLVINGDDASVTKAKLQIAELIRAREVPIKRILVIEPGRNLGVAASWNAIIRQFGRQVPYLMFAGNDICFTPGDLAKMHAFTMDNLYNAVMFGNHGHSLFTLTPANGPVGLFDENIWPAYLEDCDHMTRVRRAGALAANIPEINAIHGDIGTPGGERGSCTVNSDPALQQRNAITHTNNHLYYRLKWGGENEKEIFEHPFNDPNWPVNLWQQEAGLRLAQEQLKRWNGKLEHPTAPVPVEEQVAQST